MYQYQPLIPGKCARQKSQWQRETKLKLWTRHYHTAQQMTVQPRRPLGSATHTLVHQLTPRAGAGKASTVKPNPAHLSYLR